MPSSRPERRTTFRLSELDPFDVDDLRPESLASARADLEAFASGSGYVRPVDIDLYGSPSAPQIVLADGRHRVTMAKKLGFSRLPARITVYGLRGARRDRYPADLLLNR